MKWPDTRLLDLFGVELPIILAPMANFAGVEMAIAVAEAGGLGSLPCAVLSPDKIRDGVAEFRSRGEKPINLNFFCHVLPGNDLAKDRPGSIVSLPISPSSVSSTSFRFPLGTRRSTKQIAVSSRSFAPRS